LFTLSVNLPNILPRYLLKTATTNQAIADLFANFFQTTF